MMVQAGAALPALRRTGGAFLVWLMAATASTALATSPTGAFSSASPIAMTATTPASPAAGTSALPYDETADARADLRHALLQAKQEQKKVLVVFGANWCPDCRRLDKEINADRTAIDRGDYVIVKVDVGNFNKNTDLTSAYGNVTRKGIPAAVVLSADNQVEFQGRLVHLTSPYRRYLRPAFYAAIAAGVMLAIGGAFHFLRSRRTTRQRKAA